MQKNDKYYTFLLKRSNKSRIFFRRVEISKGIVHFGSLGIFLLAGISILGVGISGMVRSTVLSNPSHDAMASQVSAQAALDIDSKDIDYARPTDASEFSFNSGGPEIGDENDSEDSAIDAQLRAVSQAMSPELRPDQWPHEGKINNEFGFRRNPFGGRSYEFHPGMDIDGERGDIVTAPAGGTVIKASWTGGYGNMIEIDHGNGITTRYGHMSKLEVSVGDVVTRGQLLGLVGSTGRSTGPHLHFEVRYNDRPVNPRHFLPEEVIDLTKK